jgi:3-hydroxyacyl-CoA dehydrogenase
MLAFGRESFYARGEDGSQNYAVTTGGAAPVSVPEGVLFLADLKAKSKPISRNPSASLHDLGDGVLGLEFHSKMNALDELIFDQYDSALDKLDAGEFDALVVGNQDRRAFCAGANVLMILMGAMQKQWDSIDNQLIRLQKLMMRAKYSKHPVVTAPFGLTLGGGLEVAMHSTATVATGELYCGLVEVGVGLIPGAGGCKELLVRLMGDVPQGINYDPMPYVQHAFEAIGMAKTSTSAEEARSLGYLRHGDPISMNIDRQLGDAKRLAMGLAAGGYTPGRPRTIKVPGRSGLAAVEMVLYSMRESGYATEHDVTVGKALGHVLTGGDVPTGSTRTEQDLLDLEREAFLSLCGNEKSQARMQHMLQTGKPLRN